MKKHFYALQARARNSSTLMAQKAQGTLKIKGFGDIGKLFPTSARYQCSLQWAEQLPFLWNSIAMQSCYYTQIKIHLQ
jgi:hypothetical protein